MLKPYEYTWEAARGQWCFLFKGMWNWGPVQHGVARGTLLGKTGAQPEAALQSEPWWGNQGPSPKYDQQRNKTARPQSRNTSMKQSNTAANQQSRKAAKQ